MQHKVLVVDVNAIGMIGVLRSLGRAGYKTFAVAEKKDALGLYSNYARRRTAAPLWIHQNLSRGCGSILKKMR